MNRFTKKLPEKWGNKNVNPKINEVLWSSHVTLGQKNYAISVAEFQTDLNNKYVDTEKINEWGVNYYMRKDTSKDINGIGLIIENESNENLSLEDRIMNHQNIIKQPMKRYMEKIPSIKGYSAYFHDMQNGEEEICKVWDGSITKNTKHRKTVRNRKEKRW